MKRNDCQICGFNELIEIFCMQKMPVRVGVSEDNSNFLYNDLIFVQCQKCNNIQLDNLVLPEIVYEVSHNKSIVGKTWINHNIEFANFIEKHIDSNYDIFEIGDPSAKIASLLIENEKINSWHIIEPNFENLKIKKIKFIRGYFDKNFNTDKKYDLIVLSHVFEHFIDFEFTISKMSEILKNDGKIIFSVPNMQHELDNQHLPLFNMHFEHTIFLNKENIVELMKKNEFGLKEYFEYIHHSEFYVFKKEKNLTYNFENLMTIDFQKQISETINLKLNKLKHFQDAISSNKYDSFFIYGAHWQTQQYIRLGLDYKQLIGALDNDKLKIGKYLYGFDIKIFSNEILNDYKKPLVLCDMGAYTLEIKEQLHKEYPHIQII